MQLETESLPDDILKITVCEPAMGSAAFLNEAINQLAEAYHVPIGHPGLLRLIDYPRYRATLYRRGAWIDGPLRDNPSRDVLERLYQRLQRPIPELPEELAGQWTYIHFWPAQMIDIYPDSMDVWQLQPVDVLRTRATSAPAPCSTSVSQFASALRRPENFAPAGGCDCQRFSATHSAHAKNGKIPGA